MFCNRIVRNSDLCYRMPTVTTSFVTKDVKKKLKFMPRHLVIGSRIITKLNTEMFYAS